MSNAEDNLFQTQCLQTHNMYRAQHGCPALLLSQKLSDYAGHWAQVICDKNELQHSSSAEYGENVYMARGTHIEGEAPVKAWYNEIKDYDFQDGKFSPKTGHFSQVIWRSSKELGVGIARKGNASYVVASYSPAGNVEGEFQANVPPIARRAKA